MTTTLSACRWNWCTRTFTDHSALREHVESDHIAKATPVKRKDVPLLKLVETGASVPESYLTNFLVSATDSSSQSPPLPSPKYIQCGVMTDPTESPVPVISHSSDTAGPPSDGASPIQSPRQSVEYNHPPMKFADMRGTPSPTPSPVPPSPGTAYLVNKMTHNTLYPVYPRHTPHASPRTVRNHQDTTPDQPPSTPKEHDYTDPRHTNTDAGAEASPSSQDVVESQLISMGDADSFHEMDIDSVLLPGLDSQWQPQSQLPLPESFESSFVPSTVDPSQLYADNAGEF